LWGFLFCWGAGGGGGGGPAIRVLRRGDATPPGVKTGLEML
jgi:hypothetical protein